MNDLYEAAKKRVREIREEEAALNEFIRLHERTLRLLNRPAQNSLFDEGPSSVSAASMVTAASSSAPTPQRTRVTDNPKPAEVIDGAITILREHGRPMSRRELHAALGNMGLLVKGADPIKALGTMLWRGRDRLTQIEGYGYWPKGDAYQPANYFGGI